MPRKGTKLSDEAQRKQTEAIAAWHKANTVVIDIRVQKERADAYKALAKSRGLPMATLIKQLLDAELEKENSTA